MVGGGSFCGDLGMFALVMDFKEVMLTSPPELAHCGGAVMCFDFLQIWLNTELIGKLTLSLNGQPIQLFI